MKTWAKCGRENPDSAECCSECGTELASASRKSSPTESSRAEKIAVLNNEAEAERLELELNQEQIPFAIVSHRDSAFNGIFQAGHGWGHVEAPAEYKSTILAMLEEIRGPNLADS